MTAHQIELRNLRHDIGVTCTCLIARVTSEDYRPYLARGGVATERRQSVSRRAFIETRPVFPAADALAAWQAWHESRGIEVAP